MVLIFKTLSLLHLGIICATFDWNLSSGSWEKAFWICQCIFGISLLSTIGKELGPSFETKLNSLYSRMLFAKFCWNLPSGSGKEGFYIWSMNFRLGQIRGPSFKQTWIFFTQGYFVPSLVEIIRVVLEKKIFNFCQCIFAVP